MSVINPYDREILRSTYQNAKPYPHIKIDNFLESDVANAAARDYLPFEQAQTLGKTFSKVNESKKVQIIDPEKFPKNIARITAALADPSFIADLEYISGIDKLVWDPKFSGGGMHQTGPSGWLDVHVDFNFNEDLQLHRRLNILLYLNPVWESSWGGNLELWDSEVKNLVHSIEPVMNRCVFFTTSEISQHGVSAVTCPEGVQRQSIAAYYYTKDAPVGWDGKKHSTVFTARPEEYMKRSILMPAESAIAKAKSAWKGVKNSVKTAIGRS
jgi:hypothetical protein